VIFSGGYSVGAPLLPHNAIFITIGTAGIAFYLINKPELFILIYLIIIFWMKIYHLLELVILCNYTVEDKNIPLEGEFPVSLFIIAELMHISLTVSRLLFLLICWILILIGIWRDSLSQYYLNNCRTG